MKKFLLSITLASTFLMIGCEGNPIQKIRDLAGERKIQICTKGKSTSCDSKYRFTLDQVGLVSRDDNGNLVDPHTVKDINGVVFSVEIKGEIKYFGASADWQDAWNSIKDLKPAQQDHALTQFFQSMFDTYRWLEQAEVYVTVKQEDGTYKKELDHYKYFYEISKDIMVQFSEDSAYRKDLESMGAQIESRKFENLAEKLEADYGLSTKRANSVARNLSTYNKLATKRALTTKEKNLFAKELLGVNYGAAKDAILSGDKKDMDNLLETAADVNETSPEQVSAIINELFL